MYENLYNYLLDFKILKKNNMILENVDLQH